MAPKGHKKGHNSGSGDGLVSASSHVNVIRNHEMESLVKPINKLRNHFSSLDRSLDLKLPRIVAIGGQSSGKSSTIENFVGRDFLPRGDGLVTRRPLALHLVNNQGLGDEGEYGVFEHKKEERFYDFDEIRVEIMAETDRITEQGEISESEIILTLYSPHYVDVSLVDMPGVVRTEVRGQSKGIVDVIHNLNEKYVKDENTIIMAVSQASGDLATSDAMKFVNDYDPQGLRSVGVLTKLDLVDKGTEVRKKNILQNRESPLALGWIGLVNRSQDDIDNRKSITEARKDEERFFNDHPIYSCIATKMGSQYLQKHLAQILKDKVKEALPHVKDDIKNALTETKKELKMLPKLLTLKEMEMKMNDLLFDVSNSFKENIRGVGYQYVSTTEKSAGAKIARIFTGGYKKYLDEVFLDENIIETIQITIENSHGIEKGYFSPNDAVKAVIRAQIDKFCEPSENCFDDVYQELKRTLTRVSSILRMYPILRCQVENMSHSKLESLVGNAWAIFEHLVKSEKSYINFQHPQFIGFENLAKYVKMGKLEIKHIFDRDLNKQAMDNNLSLERARKSFYVLATKERVEFYGTDLNCCFSFMRFDTVKLNEKRSRGETVSGQENFQIVENEATNEITLTNVVFGSLFNGSNQITFKFENPEERKEWKEIFVTKSNALATSERKQLAHNFMLVISYKKILNTIFMDRLPKTIMQDVVSEIDNFLQKELPFEMRQLDIEYLMSMSHDDLQKVKELTAQKEAYEEAMKIIDTIDFLGVSK